ncbi:hypothetical protein, partial [Escherichia coli]|uniref:hypothetical protein n=1 Tax=Escherichia coli TaxID=562 RepID=UPI001ADDDB58
MPAQAGEDAPASHPAFFSAPMQKGHPDGWPFAKFDACPFIAGVSPPPLAAAAYQRANRHNATL